MSQEYDIIAVQKDKHLNEFERVNTSYLTIPNWLNSLKAYLGKEMVSRCIKRRSVICLKN